MQINDEENYGSKIKFIQIELAGIKIEIECKSRRGFQPCKDYLSCFENPDIFVKAAENDALAFFHTLTKNMDTGEYPPANNEWGSIEFLTAFQKISESLNRFHAFIMHGSAVAKDGFAYLFSAPSGIGKTTRTKLWLEEYPDSIVVNGDKPIIRILDGNVFVCGSPWCGKEGWNTNTMVPLRAIFLLERAEKDSIEEINFAKAFPALWGQINQPTDPAAMKKNIQFLQELADKVLFYRFFSTPTHEAIRLAYETARLR